MNKFILVAACLLAAVMAVSALPAAVVVPAEQACALNEVWNDCGTACPEHCPTRNALGEIESAPMACIMMCKVGCACASGFVRDLKRNNACVQRSLCSAP